MVKEILEQREKTHGDYKAVAAISQGIKTAIHLGPNNLPYVAQESLDMIASKMARIACGNWREIDHWRDIAGYAQLIVDLLDKEEA